jgi:hypothetical protein
MVDGIKKDDGKSQQLRRFLGRDTGSRALIRKIDSDRFKLGVTTQPQAQSDRFKREIDGY